jgi:hypothetical protein
VLRTMLFETSLACPRFLFELSLPVLIPMVVMSKVKLVMSMAVFESNDLLIWEVGP